MLHSCEKSLSAKVSSAKTMDMLERHFARWSFEFGMKQLAMELEELEDSFLISFVNESGDEELHDRNALTAFDVQYSSLTPAQRVVRLRSGEAIPLARLMYPLSVFGLAPTRTAGLNDAVRAWVWPPC